MQRAEDSVTDLLARSLYRSRASREICTAHRSEISVLRERVMLCWKHRLHVAWLSQSLALARRTAGSRP